jgi:hypothetical protein
MGTPGSTSPVTGLLALGVAVVAVAVSYFAMKKEKGPRPPTESDAANARTARQAAAEIARIAAEARAQAANLANGATTNQSEDVDASLPTEAKTSPMVSDDSQCESG